VADLLIRAVAEAAGDGCTLGITGQPVERLRLDCRVAQLRRGLPVVVSAALRNQMIAA
jgi:hypothetical protein